MVDRVTDLLLCKMSRLAYVSWQGSSRQAFVDKVGNLGFYVVRCWDYGDTQAFYCEEIGTPAGDAVERILAFRGTEVRRFRDLISDIRCLKMPGPRGLGRVHRGFKSALDFIWTEVVAFIAPLYSKTENWRLSVTGHSMGGALARMATAYMVSSTTIKDPVRLVTFGEPRMGSPCFARAFTHFFQGEDRRYVNSCDWVPMMPPWWLNYKHSGTEIYLTEDGRELINGDDSMVPWRLRLMELLKARLRHPIIAQTLRHPIERYHEKLKELAS